MTDSQRLLEAYVKHGSESAFRELVARYLDSVYSTALRRLGHDTHKAEDVAQVVFMDLARTARALPSGVMLGGWLHRHTCFVAAKTLRGERRRQAREQQAVEMNSQPDQSDANLDQIAPVLDEAINQLGAEDRTAILLRFFERLDFRAIGVALGTNEGAAQKRVSRALERLHLDLKHRGITFSAAALGTTLAARSVTAAPADLAVRISNAALASVATTGGVALTLLKLMSLTKTQLGLSAVIIAGATATLVIQHQARLNQDAENLSLRRQIVQLESNLETRQPRPAITPRRVAEQPSAVDAPVTNLFERLSQAHQPVKLTRAQVEAYLKANGRNAATLLTAFRACDDPALLQEALDKFPNDPKVDLAAIFKPGASPDEQRQWLNAFEQSDPDNSLANYLSALNYFQSGRTDEAVRELSAAVGKPQFQNYSLESVQSDVEAYLAAGYSLAEAKVFGPTINPQTPLNSSLRDLGQDMVGLAASYQQSGDAASAQTALGMTVTLGQLLDAPDEPATVRRLVGMNIERAALSVMDPAAPYRDSGQTVQAQMDQLTQQRADLMELGNQFNTVAAMMSEQDWVNYRDREMAFGQTAAQQWAITKYGQR